VTLIERDDLMIEAALEFGPDYIYNIRNGTIGITLYIQAPNKAEASHIRQKAPVNWKKLYVVVLYYNDREFTDSKLDDSKS